MHPIPVLLFVALSVACSGGSGRAVAPIDSGPRLDSGPGLDGGPGSDAGPRRDAGASPDAGSSCDCAANQVCNAGMCVDLPRECPCPDGAYCDIANNTCVAGCLADDTCGALMICSASERQCIAGCRDDDGCGGGTICTAQQCVAGCREDAQCAGANQICADDVCRDGCRGDDECTGGLVCDGTVCREGCVDDAGCPTLGELCNTSARVCESACRDDAGCPAESVCGAGGECETGCRDDEGCADGRICEEGQCRDGCRLSSECALETYCDRTTYTCEDGCGGTETQCPDATACVSFTNGTSRCQAQCFFNECAGSNWTCYGSRGSSFDFEADRRAAQCRQTCRADTDCSGGQVCMLFTTRREVPHNGSIRLCASPCSVDDACENSRISSINPHLYPCSCASDGMCRTENETTCYVMDPSAGI